MTAQNLILIAGQEKGPASPPSYARFCLTPRGAQIAAEDVGQVKPV